MENSTVGDTLNFPLAEADFLASGGRRDARVRGNSGCTNECINEEAVCGLGVTMLGILFGIIGAIAIVALGGGILKAIVVYSFVGIVSILCIALAKK